MPTESTGIKQLLGELTNKPKFQTTYKVVGKDHKKQVMDILDQMSISKSASNPDVQKSIRDPSQIKWEFVLDRAEYDPPENMTEVEDIIRYFTTNSRIYLKGTANSAGTRRLIKLSQIDSAPATILALFEQRAKFLAGSRQAASEEGTDIDEEEPQGLIAYRGLDDDNLLAHYDRWFESHPNADRRLYYYVREGVKHLVESASDRRRA
jgi:hypothetical protein